MIFLLAKLGSSQDSWILASLFSFFFLFCFIFRVFEPQLRHGLQNMQKKFLPNTQAS